MSTTPEQSDHSHMMPRKAQYLTRVIAPPWRELSDYLTRVIKAPDMETDEEKNNTDKSPK